MLTQEQLEVLLNRPLSENEVTNLALYLEITEQRLASLLCITLTSEHATRAYLTTTGYRTVMTDPFRGTAIVRVNGNVIPAEDYTARQGESLNGTWKNSIVFKRHLARTVDTISVEADFGFGEDMPADLQHFIARTFAEVGKVVEASDARAIHSKKIEDFSVTFDNSNDYATFVSDNYGIVAKYGICQMGAIRNGAVRPLWDY